MKPVLIAGSEALKQRACDLILDGGFGAFCLTEPGAGSDAGAGKTTAVKDGDEYVLNGRKCFITNGGIASFYCVTAMTDKTKGVKGMSMFFVEKGTPGLSTGKEENKMGIRTSNTCDVVLEDVRIPASNLIGEEGRGFNIAMQTLDQLVHGWVVWQPVLHSAVSMRLSHMAKSVYSLANRSSKPGTEIQSSRHGDQD